MGNPETASRRAIQEQHISSDNESLFRSFHPLRDEPYVSAKRDWTGRTMWIVWKTDKTDATPRYYGRFFSRITRRVSAAGLSPARTRQTRQTTTDSMNAGIFLPEEKVRQAEIALSGE
jgi:hypothetical protein